MDESDFDRDQRKWRQEVKDGLRIYYVRIYEDGKMLSCGGVFTWDEVKNEVEISTLIKKRRPTYHVEITIKTGELDEDGYEKERVVHSTGCEKDANDS